jgi:outer membrane protein TolC
LSGFAPFALLPRDVSEVEGMFQRWPGPCLIAVSAVTCLCWLPGSEFARSQEEVTLPPLVAPLPRLSLDEAVRLALERNPDLAALRQQQGIAAAAVVIARAYPFNPVFQAKLQGANGPPEANVTNHFVQEYKVGLELEVRGQGGHRRNAALAGLSRVEWEVAFQEVKLAARVVRAFQEVLYREQKLRLIEDRVQLNEEAEAQVAKLLKLGLVVGPADVLLVRSEVAAARSQRGPAQVAFALAWAELRRALGLVDEPYQVQGALGATNPLPDGMVLLHTALERRPDLHARAAAVAEAEARLRLEVANRLGNPTIGPVYEIDPSTITFLGGFLSMPVPVMNAHRGLIRQREAEQAKAVADHHATEVLIRQDVPAALARLETARASAETFRTDLLPALAGNLAAVEKLLENNVKGVDVVRVIDVRRNLLKGREAYLDALWDVGQAEADLVVAVGDPAVLLGSWPGPPPGPPR